MNTKRKIIDTELEYLKCFSSSYEDNLAITFRDKLITDMYSHNLTYLKHKLSNKEYESFVEKKVNESKEEGRGFLNLQFDFEISEVKQYIKQHDYEITTYDYYQFQFKHFDMLAARQDCYIKKLDNEQVDKALEFDIATNGEELGMEFVKDRFDRRSKVYLSHGLVDNYLCYYNGEIVGHCDLFINDDVAKIEDFDVAPDMQRKGFGTSILKEMVAIAKQHGAKTIYLITDNSDTAKEMYKKCGMIKVGEKTEILFNVTKNT
jgi:spore maturation protein CgeE